MNQGKLNKQRMKKMTRTIDIVEISEQALLKSKTNLTKVRANVVKKVATSTTAAQGHLGLLTSIANDIEVVESLLAKFNSDDSVPVPIVKKAAKTVKTATKTIDKDK